MKPEFGRRLDSIRAKWLLPTLLVFSLIAMGCTYSGRTVINKSAGPGLLFCGTGSQIARQVTQYESGGNTLVKAGEYFADGDSGLEYCQVFNEGN